MTRHRRIEDLGLVGDLRTAALISRDGTVEWACFPRFDSPAVFAGLLGTDDHGTWHLGPAGENDTPAPATHRRYRGDTLVLESTWTGRDGTLRITDFMPPWDGRDTTSQLIRVVEAVQGQIPIRSRLRPRFDYGRSKPLVTTTVDDRAVAVAGPHSLWFDTEAPFTLHRGALCADRTLAEGDTVTFTLTAQPSHHRPPARPDPLRALAATRTSGSGGPEAAPTTAPTATP